MQTLNPAPANPELPIRYYYIPASEAKAVIAQQQLSNSGHGTTRERGPKTGEIQKAVQRMQLPSNFHWGKNGQGLDPEWRCTVSNMKALYNFVQPEWEKCKENPNYIEPNFNATGNETAEESDASGEEAATAEEAAPSTLNWVYNSLKGHDITADDVAALRQDKAAVMRFAQHHLLSGPTAAEEIESYFDGRHSRRLLAYAGKVRAQQLTNWDEAPVLDASAPTMKQCIDFAVGNLCDMLADCDDPICDSYYNETEIESLCGICEMRLGDKDKGCFASQAPVLTRRGLVTVGDLRAGDFFRSAKDDTTWSRVIFVHDHKEPAATVALMLGSGQEAQGLEVTAQHLVLVEPVAQADGAKLVPAREARVGDNLFIAREGEIRKAPVVDIRVGRSKVRYVVTDTDLLDVDGIVAPVYSTSAGWIETLPFRFLDRLMPGTLNVPAVKASLSAALESPILKAFETLVNRASAHFSFFRLSTHAGVSDVRRRLGGCLMDLRAWRLSAGLSA